MEKEEPVTAENVSALSGEEFKQSLTSILGEGKC